MSSALENIDYNGYRIVIEHDEDPENPRSYGTFGTVYGWHRRYQIGDKHDYECGNAARLAVINENGKTRNTYSAKAYEDVILLELPVYMYDHSGIALSTEPFSCPWDSGRLGFTFVTKKRAREWFDVGKLKPEHKAQAEELLKNELKTLACWVNGEVYGWHIEFPNEDGDFEAVEGDGTSRSGYFGIDWDDMIKEAQEVVDHLIAEKAAKEKQQEESLATQGAGI